ncbi:MAG: tetratricopeptide repeat protein [Pseudomonadota bacterium]
MNLSSTKGSDVGEKEPERLPKNRINAVCLVGAISLSFLVYGGSLNGKLVFDDIPLLVENSCHHGLERIPAMFDFGEGGLCTQRPVRFVSFALDYAIWGGKVFGYHLSNIILHGLVGWLVFLLVLRIGHDRLLALLAGMFFILHPIATEAVAYVSGRRDLLAALFMLLTAHGYLSYQAYGGIWRLLLMVLGFLLAAFSHESAAVLPVAMVVFEICRHWREGAFRSMFKAKRVVPIVVLLLVAIVFVIWTVQTRNTSTRQGLWGPNVAAHVGNMLRVHTHYLLQIVFPVNLIADYSPEAFDLSRSVFEVSVLFSLAVLVGICVFAFRVLGRWPIISACIFCYFVLLLPVSQIVVHHELMAEHRLYFSAICFTALLATVLVHALRHTKKVWPVVFFICAIALAYGLQTMKRTRDWLTPKALWSRTLQQVPRCARAHSNLGAILAREKLFILAKIHLEKALSIRPDLCDAKMNLGLLFLDKGEIEKALDEMHQAIKCSPSVSYYLQLGQVYLTSKRYASAAELLQSGLKFFPDDPHLLFGFGTALHRQGDLIGAIKTYRMLVNRYPRWPKLLYRTGLVLAEACEIKEAEKAFRQFISKWPNRLSDIRKIQAIQKKMAKNCFKE